MTMRGRGSRGERLRARPARPALPTLRRALGLVGPYRLTVVGYLTTVIVASLTGLGPPLLIQQVLDKAIPQQDSGMLNVLVLAMVGLVVLGALNGTAQSYLSSLASHSVVFDLRSRVYRHLSGQSLGWFTANRTGDSVSRISSDVGAVQGVITDTLGGSLGNLITVASTMAVMLTMDWRLALFAMVFVPVFIVPAQRVGNLQRRLVTETQEQMAALNNQMQETLSVSGALLVKTFGQEDKERATFDETAAAIRRLSIRRALIGRWFNTSLNLFGSVAPAVVYWYGGRAVIGGDASIGTVVALAALLGRLFGPVSSLLGLHVSVLSSIALFERIFDYLDLAREIQDAPGAVPLDHPRGAIQFDGVSFGYAEGQATLRDVSFTIRAGQFAALVGPTGAGKTTIAYLIPRLYDADSGRVLIDDHDVRDITLQSLEQAIAMVNQEAFLFHGTLLENLRYARPTATDAEVEAAAQAANIHAFIDGLPERYDTVVGERGYRLSGGEKQRVAIARALLKDPAILILDEATSSVDSATEHAIQEALERLAKGRTVVAIAHRLSTVRSADIILVIEHGHVVDSGRHEELLARGGLYARLYAQQFATPDTVAPAGG